MFNKNYILLSIILIFAFAGCVKKDINQNSPEIVMHKTFNVQTSYGKTLTIHQYDDRWVVEGINNKVILLDFFATWCPPCKAEIPHLTNIQKKYKDNFEIIGILLEQNKSNDELNNFIKQHSINYTVVNDVNGQKIANTIGNVRSIPTMFLINQKGNIIQHYLGIVPEEMLESDIKKALGK